MRTPLIVIVPPPFDHLLGVSHRHEAAYVETFVSQSAVETLDKRVLHGLAGPDEVQFDAPSVGPLVKGLWT